MAEALTLAPELVAFLESRGHLAEVAGRLALVADAVDLRVVGSVAAGSTTPASDLDMLAVATYDDVDEFVQSLDHPVVSPTVIGCEVLGHVDDLEVNLEVVTPAAAAEVLAPAIAFARAVDRGDPDPDLPVPGERELRLGHRLQGGIAIRADASVGQVKGLNDWGCLLIALYVITALDFVEDAASWKGRDDHSWRLMLQEAREAAAFAAISQAGSYCPQRKWLARELRSAEQSGSVIAPDLLEALVAPAGDDSIEQTADHVRSILHGLVADPRYRELGTYLDEFTAVHYSASLLAPVGEQ